MSAASGWNIQQEFLSVSKGNKGVMGAAGKEEGQGKDE